MFLYGVLWVGWVGGSPCGVEIANLFVAMRLVSWIAWKKKFRFEKFQLAAFRYLEFSDVAKSSLESHIVSVKLLDV